MKQFNACYSLTRIQALCTDGSLSAAQVELAYRGSEDETRDLLRLYTKFRGDMQQARHAHSSSSRSTGSLAWKVAIQMDNFSC